MARTHRTFPLLPLLLLLTACEKDIDVDYHQVSPLYVVEASVTPDGTTVRISMTQDMDSSSGIKGVEGASVLLTSGDSIRQHIAHSRNGVYRSTLKGKPGTRYQLDIDLDGRHFTSASTMQPMPTVNDFRFAWQKFGSERFLLGDLRIQDFPNATNYYFMHVYRNGVGYRWAVATDKQRDSNGELQQLFTCVSERDMKKNSGDALHDGDVIRINVRAIDKSSYDYLFSMQSMGDTGTNPIPNFTGGCLGYFSAYSQVSIERVFYLTDVEDAQ